MLTRSHDRAQKHYRAAKHYASYGDAAHAPKAKAHMKRALYYFGASEPDDDDDDEPLAKRRVALREERERTSESEDAEKDPSGVMFDDAYDVFKRHFDQAEGEVRSINIDSLEKYFDVSGFPVFREGPIQISVYRADSKSETEATMHCGALKSTHFYLMAKDGKDSVFMGGKFKDLIGKLVIRKECTPKMKCPEAHAAVGYKDNKQNPTFVPHRGFLFASTKAIGRRLVRGTWETVSPCVVTKVVFNWQKAWAWLEATRRANDELLRAGKTHIIATDGPRDKTVGVIGWDTPLEVPSWLQELFPKASWSIPTFPRLTDQGRIKYFSGGQTCATLETAIETLQSKQPDRWSSIWPFQIRTLDHATAFLQSAKHRYALAAWSGHARVLFKVTGGASIYDPWKQVARVPEFLGDAGSALGKNVTFTFTKHEADQEFGEGSCQFASLARLLMLAVYGDSGISMRFSASEPEALAIPVAAQMLIRTSRGRAKRKPVLVVPEPRPPAYHDDTKSGTSGERAEREAERQRKLAHLIPEDIGYHVYNDGYEDD